MEILYYFDDQHLINLFENEGVNENTAHELDEKICSETFATKEEKEGYIKALYVYCHPVKIVTEGQYLNIRQTVDKEPEKMNLGQINEDIPLEKRNLPVFVYDLFTGNLHDVMNVDATITDRIDIHINTEKLSPFYEQFMETYFQIACSICNMPPS